MDIVMDHPALVPVPVPAPAPAQGDDTPPRAFPSPPNGADKAIDPKDPKWKISSVRWDDTLVNRLLSSIRANPAWASSIARGALTSIDPGGSSSRMKAPLSKTDAIREVTRALFSNDPEYDLEDPVVQRSLLVSVRNKLYKLQPLDELLSKNDTYSSIAMARKEALEALEDGPSVRRSMRVPLARKYAEDLDSDADGSSRASPRPGGVRTPSRAHAIAAKGGIVPRHAPPEPAVRKPWRPPLPLRPHYPTAYPAITTLRTVADIRRAYFENERTYLSASLERLTREAEERKKLDEDHLRLLRLEIESREKMREENRTRFESKAAKLREKIANADEEIRKAEPPKPAEPAPEPAVASGQPPMQNGFTQTQQQQPVAAL
ncbi:hypothetical protein CALVIDRAFT_563689 [Calocera viscosa TUFC12733]|uniref:Uncharacterized protein n=1 Tax=Calocera viscosa (strain TUFC12733) TaxID=1330018 RepID=A0A167MDV6_CALVF|nr:hypothetical protein CALVIDRAFT_563689 [Calocera viscosa TUFC12733]